MEREQAVRLMQNLLRKMVEKEGSDLFITTGFPPAIKVELLARLGRWAAGRIEGAEESDAALAPTREAPRAVIIGFGRVGRLVGEHLGDEHDRPYVAIDSSIDVVKSARREGFRRTGLGLDLPHVHTREDEFWFVVDGTFEIRLGHEVHFLERGFHHFGFAGFANDGWARERRDGFVEALRLDVERDRSKAAHA